MIYVLVVVTYCLKAGQPATSGYKQVLFSAHSVGNNCKTSSGNQTAFNFNRNDNSLKQRKGGNLLLSFGRTGKAGLTLSSTARPQ